MFTDIVGYTALAQVDEARALEILEEQRALLEPIVGEHRGNVVKSLGDGYLFEFGSAVDGARCAIRIQERLRERNEAADRANRFRLRIGLHVGDIVRERGDVLGDGVNVASRVEGCAPPGGIRLTEDVARQVRNKLDLPVESVGRRRLKNVERPVRLYRIVLPWEKTGGVRSRLAGLQSRATPARILTASVAALVLVGLAWRIVGGGAIAAGEIDSLAVLPLENLSRDPDQEYFADGMTEALISELAGIGALRVISPTSVMRLADAGLTIPEIAAELGVDAVVDGSVQREGERVRIRAQLVEGPTGRILWTETWTREMRDVLALQSEVALDVVERIRIELTPAEERRLARARPVDPAAHEAYLKGRAAWHEQTTESIAVAIEHFERALTIDPDYALALAGLADAHLVYAHFGMRPREALSEAKRHALLALELDPDLAEAHTALADARYHLDWDWEAAEVGFRRAIEIRPGYATAHWWYSGLLATLGRHDEAIEEIRRAEELDPLFAGLQAFAVRVYYWAGRPGLARAEVERLRQALPPGAPDGLNVYTFHAVTLPQELVERMEAARRAGEGHPAFLFTLALQHASHGREAEARATLDDLVPMADRWPYQIARVHAALGDREEALDWLDRAAEVRDAALVWVDVEPLFDDLRGEPRFAGLLRRMDL